MPHIFIRRRQIHPLGDVDESGKADRRINQKSADLNPGSLEFSLEDVVEKAWGKPSIVKEVVDSDLEAIGNHEIIPLGNRLQHPLVQLPIELEDFCVERLPRIIFLAPALIILSKRIIEVVVRRRKFRFHRLFLALRRPSRGSVCNELDRRTRMACVGCNNRGWVGLTDDRSLGRYGRDAQARTTREGENSRTPAQNGKP